MFKTNPEQGGTGPEQGSNQHGTNWKDGVAPAIRNAIINATGVAINEIPFTPERVWQKIRESEI